MAMRETQVVQVLYNSQAFSCRLFSYSFPRPNINFCSFSRRELIYTSIHVELTTFLSPPFSSIAEKEMREISLPIILNNEFTFLHFTIYNLGLFIPYENSIFLSHEASISTFPKNICVCVAEQVPP